MGREITDYLSKYIDLNEDLKNIINANALVKEFEKGTVLLKKGDRSTESFYILKGCIRCYYLKNGEEKTTDFYTEEQAVIPSCYGKQEVSKYFLECIEDTIAGVNTPETESEMYQECPELESISRFMGDLLMAQHQEMLDDFEIITPEERYLNLLKNRPELLQRIPQHLMASHLGVQPEAVSLVREKAMKKL